MKPNEIIQKVGADRIRKAMESTSGDALKELLESEGIVLTPEQLDYVAGGVGLDVRRTPIPRKHGRGGSNGDSGESDPYDDDYIDDGSYTCDGSPETPEPATCTGDQ